MRLNALPALFLLASLPLRADAGASVLKALEAMQPQGSLKVGVHLDVEAKQTIRRETESGRASVGVEVEDLPPSSLRVAWDRGTLNQADEEAHQRDQGGQGLPVVRDALKELDPGRLGHLLNQAHSLAGLLKGATFVKEGAGAFEGASVRLLEFRFTPRLSWSEAYYLKSGEGVLRVWLDAEGLPLGSESLVTYQGKTSRMFGRYEGRVRVWTRYRSVGGRLVAVRRETDEHHAKDDGAEVTDTRKTFLIEVR